MAPPRPHTVNAGGFTTRYWESTPPGQPRGIIVLIHDGAFGGDAIGSWSAVMPLLAQHYRVLAPDLLGYGDTDKVVYLDRSPYAFRTAHLAAFCRALDIDAAHFAGQSFGGSLLLRAVATPTPELPALSAVSICGTGGPWRSSKGVTELGRFDGTEDDMRRLVALMTDDYAGFDDTVALRYANTRKPGHVTACLAPACATPTSQSRKTATTGPPHCATARSPFSSSKPPATTCSNPTGANTSTTCHHRSTSTAWTPATHPTSTNPKPSPTCC